MKIIVEVESDEELKKVERFLPWIDPSLIRRRIEEKKVRIQQFLTFIDREATPVKHVEIPEREHPRRSIAGLKAQGR